MKQEIEARWYVVFYDGKGNKGNGFDCTDAVDAIAKLNRYGIKDNCFSYVSAACFMWLPNQLPIRQWYLEID